MMVAWFARGAGIKRIGPFSTELEAWEALQGTDGEPIEAATVWVERINPKLSDAEARVIGAITWWRKKHGAGATLKAICGYLAEDDRVVDRILQRLRKRGVLTYERESGWSRA